MNVIKIEIHGTGWNIRWNIMEHLPRFGVSTAPFFDVARPCAIKCLAIFPRRA
jgi:hypothetical protein